MDQLVVYDAAIVAGGDPELSRFTWTLLIFICCIVVAFAAGFATAYSCGCSKKRSVQVQKQSPPRARFTASAFGT